MKQLADGESYNNLSKKFVPKSEKDEERLIRLGQKTKQQLYKDLKLKITAGLKDFKDDKYLLEIEIDLSKRKPEQFNPKTVLVNLCSQVDNYLEDLYVCKDLNNANNDSDLDSDCD